MITLKHIYILAFLIIIVSLSCKKEIYYDLYVSVTPNGTGTTSITSGTHPAGQSVTITATPNPEYIFKSWKGSLTSSSNPLTFIMDSTKSIIAEFEKRQYPLSLTIEGSGVVKEEIVITQAKVGSYPSGTNVKLTAVPDSGWEFTGWSTDTTTTANPIIITVNKNVNLKATFNKTEPLKFITNLDTLTNFNVIDTLPIKISITSKLPLGGILCSISASWLDSSKQIIKIDTTLTQSNFSTVLTGFKNAGNYNVTITTTAKSNINNSLKKSTNLSRFISWTVDTIYTPASNQLPVFRNSRMQGRLIFFNQNNIENFIVGGATWFGNPNHILYPLLHFNKPVNNWKLVGELSSVELNEIRNWRYLEDGSGIVFTDHGPEWPDIEWPYGNIYVSRFIGNSLSWTKVNKNKSFYHDVAAGDINGDGIIDIVGSHMGTRNGNNDNPHIYMGKTDGTFQEILNTLPNEPPDYPDAPSGGDVEIFDLDSDGQNEIINFGAYPEVYSLQYFKYNKITNTYSKKLYFKGANPMNIPSTYDDSRLKSKAVNNYKGYMPVGKRFQDFNNDGIMDFISESDGMTIWYGKGNNDFTPTRVNTQGIQDPTTQLPIFPNYNMSGHLLLDLESDGDPDVIPFILNFGNKNTITEVDLSRMIFINDNGIMRRLSSNNFKITKNQFGGNTPDNLLPFIRNGKLCFGGYLGLTSYPEFNYTLFTTISTNISASYWYK